MTHNSATNDVLILIPAAGASSRMRGRDKLLERVDGHPLLPRQVARALHTGSRVLVTLAQDRPARAQALAQLPHERLSLLTVDGREGMAVSIRTGGAAARARGVAALMIMLPDMPELESEDLQILIDAHLATPDATLRAASQVGAPGHPVIIPRRLFQDLDSVTGDAGAREVLQGEQVRLIPLRGERAVTDLDTPEEWTRWQCLFR